MLNLTAAEWERKLHDAETAIDALHVQPGLSRLERVGRRSKLIDVCVDARFYFDIAKMRAA